jgi:hypothetical protein
MQVETGEKISCGKKVGAIERLIDPTYTILTEWSVSEGTPLVRNATY